MRATDRNATPLLLLLLALGLSVGCGRGGEDRDAPHGHADESEHAEAGAHEPEIPDSVRLTGAAIAESGIQTWKVQSMDLEHLLVLTGTIGHDENRLLHVASNLRGRVAEIPVDLGQRVRKGDPIVWIESVDLSHAWDEFVKALSDLRIAERAYERARSLLETKAISAGEYQVREGAYLARNLPRAAE